MVNAKHVLTIFVTNRTRKGNDFGDVKKDMGENKSQKGAKLSQNSKSGIRNERVSLADGFVSLPGLSVLKLEAPNVRLSIKSDHCVIYGL